MACRHLELPDGTRVIVCGPRPRLKRCVGCGQPASRLCDFKPPNGKTCDAPVCDRCTTSYDPEKDLCPLHRKVFDQWRARQLALPMEET